MDDTAENLTRAAISILKEAEGYANGYHRHNIQDAISNLEDFLRDIKGQRPISH